MKRGHNCKTCNVNKTHNAGGVCTNCLNGEDPVIKGMNLAFLIASHIISSPLSSGALARRLVLSARTVEEVVKDHPWFRRERALVVLTPQGRREHYRHQTRAES